MTATEPTPTLLLDTTALARELHVSRRHVERLAASGALPDPVRLGRAERWSRETISAWIASGCPSRDG